MRLSNFVRLFLAQIQHFWAWVCLISTYAACLSGCALEPLDDSAFPCGDLLSGDIVITELMAVPDPKSGNPEWIEVYNTTLFPIQLLGMTLETSKIDETALNSFRLSDVSVPSDSYFVFAASDVTTVENPNLLPAEFGPLNDKQGKIALKCKTAVIDEISYTPSVVNTSRLLDGKNPPDAILNDDIDRWCDAANPYTKALFGSPGKQNASCGPAGTALPEFCENPDASLRRVTVPTTASIVITEIMPDPDATPDSSGEWIEIRILQDIDLNGLELSVNGKQYRLTEDQMCSPARAGQLLLFTNDELNLQNKSGYVLDFSLPNNGATIELSIANQLLDRVIYTESTAGKSLNLDILHQNASDNDNINNWCQAEPLFETGDAGSPGLDNHICQSALPAGYCWDGEFVREINAPEHQDLLISEIMANPDQVSDTLGEWIELYAVRTIDLNGLSLARDSPENIQSSYDNTNCLTIDGGSHILLSRSADPVKNGGLPPIWDTFNFSLLSKDTALYLILNDMILDSTGYEQTDNGVAVQKSLNSIISPQTNQESWCNAAQFYGDGDMGTPGTQNRNCPDNTTGPAAGWCIDQNISRPVRPPASGDLVITEVLANPQAVNDQTGEWIELQSLAAVDLNDLTIGRRTASSSSETMLTAEHCITVDVGGIYLLARSDNPGNNGGLPEVLATFDLALPNSQNTLYLETDTIQIDEVTYPTAIAGTSYSLDPNYTSASNNDTESVWCASQKTYGLGDLGSPGSGNESCRIVPMDYCYDAGLTRPAIYPQAGDLVITEIMADPTQNSDAQAEWFEIKALASVDLNRITVSRSGSGEEQLSVTECNSVAAESYHVFAHSNDPNNNGGLGPINQIFNLTLPNSGENQNLALYSHGLTMDAIGYKVLQSGSSYQLDPDHVDPIDNDSSTHWCSAVLTYGNGDLGTPGGSNSQCD